MKNRILTRGLKLLDSVVRRNDNTNKNVYSNQCDQMAKLFVQYLAVYNNEN